MKPFTVPLGSYGLTATTSFSILPSLSLAHSILDTSAFCACQMDNHTLCLLLYVLSPSLEHPPHLPHIFTWLTASLDSNLFPNVISPWRPSLATLFNITPHQYLYTLVYLSSWLIAFLLHRDVRRQKREMSFVWCCTHSSRNSADTCMCSVNICWMKHRLLRVQSTLMS